MGFRHIVSIHVINSAFPHGVDHGQERIVCIVHDVSKAGPVIGLVDDPQAVRGLQLRRFQNAVLGHAGGDDGDQLSQQLRGALYACAYQPVADQ